MIDLRHTPGHTERLQWVITINYRHGKGGNMRKKLKEEFKDIHSMTMPDQ